MANISDIGNDIVNSLAQQIGNVGNSAIKTILNSLWPRDFELYMVSLELTNYKDELLDYMTFPVNPESIQKNEPQLKNIERSYGAIAVTKLGQTIPHDINIRGNFGKSFKVLLRTSGFSGDFKSLVGKTSSGMGKDELSPFFKSGYGCLKVLQNICAQSDKLDDGKSRRLYFHNFMLGESYLVEVLQMTEDQSMSNNMIWGYNLSLKVLTQINLTKGKRLALGTTGLLQNTITDVVDSCVTSLETQNYSI